MDLEQRATQESAHLEQLGFFIRERRKALGITQTQLAQQLGWVQERISVLENGKYGMPSVQGLARIATALDSTLPEILTAAGFVDGAGPSLPRANRGEQTGMALLYTLQRLFTIEATSLKGALDDAADMLANVMSADKVDAFVYEPETDTLAALGSSNTPMGRRQFEIGMNRLPIVNGGREVEVYQTGTPYNSGHAKDDPSMLRGITEGLGVQSLIIVPLNVGEQRRGILVSEASRPDHFTEDDLPFVQAVAHWIGMMAHRAELAEQITADAVQSAREAAAEEVMTVLAHDLANHLTPLKGHIDLVRRKAHREGQVEYLHRTEQALQAITRIELLTSELLDVTRLEQGLFTLTVAPVDITCVVEQVARAHEGSGHTIDVHAPHTLMLEADAGKLRQALENLVSNAVQHSPTGASVNVEARCEARENGKWIAIYVRDDGAGISADVLPRLFTRFSKGSASRGLGLGLYLARGIAVAHGGTLTVDSASGAGSTFMFSLPVERLV